VICQHPDYQDSYLPGIVQQAIEGMLVVVFHDATAVNLQHVKAYKIPDEK
jgi:hypothetical protein